MILRRNEIIEDIKYYRVYGDWTEFVFSSTLFAYNLIKNHDITILTEDDHKIFKNKKGMIPTCSVQSYIDFFANPNNRKQNPTMFEGLKIAVRVLVKYNYKFNNLEYII